MWPFSIPVFGDRSCWPSACADPSWLQEPGGISDSSSESSLDEDAEDEPPEPVLPVVSRDVMPPHVAAAWDLITRPDGMSVRRLAREYRRRHGRVHTGGFMSDGWLADVLHCPFFEFFVPHRESLAVPPELRVRLECTHSFYRTACVYVKKPHTHKNS